MTKPGLAGLQRAARWFRNKFVRGARILLYHRVAELSSDPQLLCVTPQHFGEHLEVLRRHYHPIRLQQLVRGLRDGNLPRRAVVVTFDDGYADNLHHAKPLLERYDIPATVFVTTGYIGYEREFWWDELERLLLQPGVLPETLHLGINGSVYQWTLGEAAYYSADTYMRHRGWNVSAKDDPNPRHVLYRSLCQLLRTLVEQDRRRVLEELLVWAGAESMGRRTHRVLSPDEIARLAQERLVEVGAHTVTHSVLSTLPAVAQQAEIQGSKDCLEDILGDSVTSFAYPYGSRSDYMAGTVAIVRDAGFTCACSNFAEVVGSGRDPFQLPRVLVRDWDSDDFARRLERWFRG